MSNNTKKLKELLDASAAELKTRWEGLVKDVEELRKVVPGFMPPWVENEILSIKATGPIRSIFTRSGGLKQLILDQLPETPEQAVGYNVLRNNLKDSGYQEGYIYNSAGSMVDKVIDGFVVKRYQPDGQRPRFYKVKAA